MHMAMATKTVKVDLVMVQSLFCESEGEEGSEQVET